MKAIIFFILFVGFVDVNPKEMAQTTSKTDVTFKVKNMGVFIKGKFTDVTIESNFNKDDLNNSNIQINIEIASLDTDNNKRDKDLKKSKFFDVDKFPKMMFFSTKIENISGSKYEVTGNITIKNTTKLIVLNVDIQQINNALVIESNFEVNRQDYNVGGNSWVMSDKVLIYVLISK